MRIGPGRLHHALEAAALVGVASREGLYWALHATLVSREEERALFHAAFERFFRGPAPAPVPLPGSRLRPTAAPPAPGARRAAEALAPRRPRRVAEVDQPVPAYSAREALRRRDFEQLSAEELREAEAAVSALRLPIPELETRRLRPDPRGDRLDARATLRAALRAGPDTIPLRWRAARTRPPAVVALCDVSGSMGRYARLLLRFLHALAQDRPHVHVFTFGTRLTEVTRHLRHRDPDAALAAVAEAVPDWDGGTRIGAALREFNLRWSRRVLAQGAIVLLFTDGLDREEGRGLAEETDRLRRSCRRLVWLNPLLRYAGFEPRAAGIRAMLPRVDAFRPVHDLESLAQLAEALGEPLGRRGASGAARPSRSAEQRPEPGHQGGQEER
jgi:uncharacterized protein with von Willebrand factor type A (vWA) domain